MKLYVCGPMTGIPQFNYPAFEAAAAHLRRESHDVSSPVELDTPAVRKAALASATGNLADLPVTHGSILGEDVKLIASPAIEALVVLPGWRRSTGARLETYTAFLYHKPVYYYPTMRRVPRSALMSAWMGRPRHER